MRVIYIDIDGTLGDFRRQWFYCANERIRGEQTVDCSKLKNCYAFTSLMPLTPFGEFVKKQMRSKNGTLDFVALTVIQNTLNHAQAGGWICGRNVWMDTHFPSIPIFYAFTMKGCLRPNPNDILVDDSKAERNFWRAYGAEAMTPEEFTKRQTGE